MVSILYVTPLSAGCRLLPSANCMLPIRKCAPLLRGPGGLRQNYLEIDFIVVSDRGE